MTISGSQRLEPIVKRVTVPTTLDRAFHLFTAEMSAWWPLGTHSVGGGTARGVDLDGRAGGEIVEHTADGGRHVWGTVSAWDPPTRVAFSWHPGDDPAAATQVEVRFAAVDGGTEVELTHSDWDRRADGFRVRQRYDSGWDLVLGRYVDHQA